ncbi:MAG: hypothetical protein ACYCWW_11065 [Deltaproteobacteria bacterium]
MRTLTTSLLVAALLAGCQKAPPPPPPPPAPPSAPLPPPPPAPQGAVTPPAPVTEQDEVSRALSNAHIEVRRVEKLPPLGREGCQEERRERLVLSGDGFVDVNRFASAPAAKSCWEAMRKQFGKNWGKEGPNLVVKGRWLGQIGESLPPAERERVRGALEGSL